MNIEHTEGNSSDQPAQSAVTPKDGKAQLVEKAILYNLYYEEFQPLEEPTKCEFISCQETSILFLEGFYVCLAHGLRLIKCLTEKMKDDTLSASDNG